MVVEVVVGVVQGARAFAVTHLPVGAVAVANEAVSARHGLQHVGEVFGAHGGFLQLHIAWAHDVGHHLTGQIAFCRVVDSGRVVALKLKSAGGAKGSAGVLGHLAHALLDQVKHVQAEGAHGALHFAVVGHHVGGFARVDHGDRDDARVDRFFVAADDGLKGLHHLAGHRHRVDAVVRQGGVAAFAMDGDFEFVARRHDRARAERELSERQTRPVVHAKHRLHGELGEQTVLDHFTGPTPAFFGRLEDEIHRAVEVSVLGQMLRGGQQHGHMAIVTAGVHLAWVLTGVGELVELLHGQGVHVSPQTNGARAVAVFQDAHHPSLAQATVDGDAPFGELLGHQVGGAQLLKAELGVGVDVAAQGADAGRVCDQGIKDFHHTSLAAPRDL